MLDIKSKSSNLRHLFLYVLMCNDTQKKCMFINYLSWNSFGSGESVCTCVHGMNIQHGLRCCGTENIPRLHF